MHDLLHGQEPFAAVEALPVLTALVQLGVDRHAGGPVRVRHGHGQESALGGHPRVEQVGCAGRYLAGFQRSAG